MASTDVDTFATETQLADEIGAARLATVLPSGTTAKLFRTQAYEDVLESLGRRTPPIYEGEVGDKGELRRAVVYGAAARLFRHAKTSDQDVWAALEKTYQRMFDAEVQGVKPTVVGLRGNASSISLERR